ncbi:MAG TPA: DinB family protein [Candidatus Dormibacteraeota bacterium]|nr:DinB family protein [Candidatus Dormibacteraeota bacterium]
MGLLLVEAFRYHKWANGHLFSVCEGFTQEQLQLTAPGTYGTIAATFQHLVGAEQGYIKRLGGREPRVNLRMDFPGIATLKTEMDRSDDELIELAARIGPDDSINAQFQDGRFRVMSGVILIQALHHGNDHRTHICTILGHHGMTYGDMDVWAYGDATGAIVPLAMT